MIEGPSRLARGQALEFEIWSDLIKQSRGALHIFLPLLDRGLDAVVHRLTDGNYVGIQVKGRAPRADGLVDIVVSAAGLVDDHALLVVVPLENAPNQVVLVVEERVFRQLAARDVVNSHEVFAAAFSTDPQSKSKWARYVVPRELLAERILGSAPTSAFVGQELPPELEPSERRGQWLGFLGESHVIRLLAESPPLDLFRPFPDLEMVEVLALDNVNRHYVGLQVKAGTQARYDEAIFRIRKSTLTLSTSTWLVGLAWVEVERRFADEFLIVPAKEVPHVGVNDGDSIMINFHPEDPRHTRADPYRHRLSELAELVFNACAGPRP